MYNPSFKFYTQQYILFFFLLVLLQLSACSEGQDTAQTNSLDTVTQKENNEETKNNSRNINTDKTTQINYKLLQKKILYGAAEVFDVKQALTQNDVGALTNTVHGLYAMRWHRGVYNLLEDIWAQKREDYPNFAWESLDKIPVKIALASTINRIKIINTEEQLKFIRAHKDDEHEFHRAQVVVALGMNGDLDDIEYIKSMAMDDNHYVAQSALSGLALMGGEEAKYALAEIWKKFQGTPRGDLAEQLIQKVYKVSPTLEKPVTKVENDSPVK